jgi:hypothetical protein
MPDATSNKAYCSIIENEDAVLINVYGTHKTPPPPNFPHQHISYRNLSDPELSPHLSGFGGYIMKGGKAEMTTTRYELLRHIEIVKHNWSMLVLEEDALAFAEWATSVGGICFFPDGTVRDPYWYILDPEPDAEASMPVFADSAQRKKQSESVLEEKNIPFISDLPSIASEHVVETRGAKDVMRRAYSLLVVAVRAESLASGDPLAVSFLQTRLPLGFEALSPQESQFLAQDKPSQQDLLNFTWRYEALFTLLWALGWAETLPFPADICNVPWISQTMRDRLESDTNLLDNATIRPTSEILDALDLHLRLHWATTDARVNKKFTVEGVEPGVIQERHHALNWLIRFEEAEWDDVTTPT